MPSILNATTSSGLVTSADNSGSLQLATNNGTTAVTIDTSQNVGIGTASPSNKLHVVSTTQTASTIESTSTDVFAALKNSGSTTFFGNTNAGSFIVQTSGSGYSTKLSVDSSGNLGFNSGYGSAATAYGCRAWVNFNGTGTVAIRASGNVSSITDNGTGDYTVNLSTAMPDVNYSAFVSCGVNSSDGNYANQISLNSTNSAVNNYYQAPTTTTMRFIQRNSGFNFSDPTHCYVSFFR